MYSMGNFSLDDVLSPSVPGDSFLYDGDIHDELEWQGFDILTFMDNSSWVTSVSVLVSTTSRSQAVLAQDGTATFPQAPDSQTANHTYIFRY